MEKNASRRVLSEYRREKKNLIRLGGSTTFFKEKIVNPVKKDKNGVKQVDKVENSLKEITPDC